MDSNNKIKIWHWNANGFRCRKAVLQQHLRSLEPMARPDVIAIQETHAEDTPTLPGYRAHACPPSTRTCGKGAAQGVCTFIRKGIAHVKHQQFLGNRDTAIELCVTELAISGKGRGARDGKKRKTTTTVFLANTYSNPRHGKQKFKTLFHKVKDATIQAQRDLAKRGNAAAIICGDFNAQHRELGYTTTTSKGRDLLEDATEAEFTLLTNPAHPSRIGTSAARDTNPDLAFAMLPDGGTARWKNTGINLGSDHFIIEIELPLAHLNGNPNRSKTTTHKLVDWGKFRNTELGNIDDIDDWSAQLLAATERATEEIEAPEDIETMDPRLAHLLEARRSLQKRWRRKRHNRKLRKKIAELGREIERYSRQLCSQQWFALCSQADGQLHRSGTWKLLRQLMDETKSCEYQRTRMAQILHTTARQLGEEELYKRLNERYLPITSNEDHPDYAGQPNSHLDRDIETWEVRQAAQDLNCRSAAGPDKVTNKALRNLSDAAITSLTRYYNDCWRDGKLPNAWKTAKTILLPKPNKPPGIEGLRPISLTSCVGKMLEHVLNTRWNRYLEAHNVYPDSMLGFRAKLGTQDAMLLIQREVLDPPGGIPKNDNRAILGLDLQSAFDNVRHSAILAQVSRLGLGVRSYNYIRAFLSGRTARLEVGGTKLEEREMGSVGTPQGSVISPFLFNIVMIEVARRLEALGPGIRHCLYADDVTIWATGGSDGDIEAGLQAAVEAVESALSGTGLRCSPQKSQLLILPPPGRHKKKASQEAVENIVVRTSDGVPIPHAPGLRILGMFVDGTQTNATAVKNITTKMGIAARLIKRVSSRYRGMNERGLLRLLQAFVVSHAAYAGAFHRWTCAERAKIDAAIRKAYTGALGLLPGTKTTALLSLGAHNTLSEISEAQRASQLSRLSSTAAGRRLLDRAGLLPPGERVGTGPYGELEEQALLSDEAARKIIVYPLPKNTDPERDEGRRAARAVALARQHQQDEGAVYVDAARYPRRRNSFVATVVRATTGELLTASTVRARTAGQAEEVAIALAMGLPGTRTVLSDSKSAIKNFARGTIWQGTERLMRSIEATWAARGAAAGPTIALKWFPAHMGRQLAPDIENRNEEADAAARDLITCRTAAARPSETSGEDQKEDFEPLTDYGGILAAYREVRRAFPHPHRELSRAEAVKFRQLQTECVLTPALARHVCPDMFVDAKCSVCERELATLRHIMWGGCNSAMHSGNGQCQDATYPEEVRAWIRSEDLKTQRRAIQRLEEALAKQRRKGADDPSNGRGGTRVTVA